MLEGKGGRRRGEEGEGGYLIIDIKSRKNKRHYRCVLEKIDFRGIFSICGTFWDCNSQLNIGQKVFRRVFRRKSTLLGGRGA